MSDTTVYAESSTANSTMPELSRWFHQRSALLLILMSLIPIANCGNRQQEGAAGAEPVPEPAVQAILEAFDEYQVVAMPEAHGMKDLDDFILTLIRTPHFSDKVDDIVVECGNSLYQPILDRYIAGEDVEFTEARKAWRNTMQPMCDQSGFFEQLFPLVRAMNQKLAPEKRLRVVAGRVAQTNQHPRCGCPIRACRCGVLPLKRDLPLILVNINLLDGAE